MLLTMTVYNGMLLYKGISQYDGVQGLVPHDQKVNIYLVPLTGANCTNCMR